MRIIESKANPIIKRALKALSQPAEAGLILIEGHKLLKEAISSGAKPQMVFVEHPDSLNDMPELESVCFQVSRGLLREISSVQNPAEIIAFLTPQPAPDLDKAIKKAAKILLLDRLQDPGNIGTIIRTGEAMGIDLLIMLKGCCSIFNHKIARAAMGSNFRLPICHDADFSSVSELLQKYQTAMICADMEGKPVADFQFPLRAALVLGQEGKGLDQKILNECNSRLAIPMQGRVESLNVATSAAICLYEWARSRPTGSS